MVDLFRKVYKILLTLFIMKIHHIFYIVGIIFIFASVWYFAREFIASLPDPIKLTLLIVSVVLSFILAEMFRGSNL